ncbi:hypothetical protein PINS_up012575 [Pythium insidiosum]|nr:hypothetical protein PINS_up012575 [Pythium insidiosum]
MQFEPPTKPTDVAVNINAGNSSDDSSSQGTDHNGLVTGRWKTGLFGFTDSLVPNGTSITYISFSRSFLLSRNV